MAESRNKKYCCPNSISSKGVIFLEDTAIIENDNKLLGKTFFWMFLGLLGSAIIAWYSYSSGIFLSFIENGQYGIVLIIELATVLIFNLLYRKLPAAVVGILLAIYSMVNGVTLSVIFYVYELNSIIYLFVASALVFGILAFIGYNTEKDLSSWRVYLSVFLIVGLVLSIINLFIGNSTFDLILDWVILLVFLGVTIYDINKLKLLASSGEFSDNKIHIYLAMQLYLDFINIFIRILSIFGKRRD